MKKLLVTTRKLKTYLLSLLMKRMKTQQKLNRTACIIFSLLHCLQNLLNGMYIRTKMIVLYSVNACVQ